MKNLSRNEWDIDIIGKNKVVTKMNNFKHNYIKIIYLESLLVSDPQINRFMLISYANDSSKEINMDTSHRNRIVRQLYNAKSLKGAIRIFNYNFSC